MGTAPNRVRRDFDLTSADLDEVSNVLVLGPSCDPLDDEVCGALLSGGEPDRTNLLGVTVDEAPDDRIAAWRAHAGAELPSEMGIVDVGEGTRSAAAATVEPAGAPPASIVTVENPRDLTGMGIRITEFLSGWEDNGNRTVACFHSLTALLEYADLQPAFRFLHVLVGRMKSLDAVAHYHLDPDGVDEQEIDTLKTLMDAIVEIDDGGWRVTRR